MGETTGSSGAISRRSFIKGAGAAAAAAGAAGAASSLSLKNLAVADESEDADSATEEQCFAGACRGNCGCGCFLNIYVRDGRVVRTSARDMPDTSYNRICVKGLTQPHRVYNDERIKYPMRQTGERGSDNWERISWDEALDEVADKWNGYVEEFGKESVGVLIGSGNYAVVNGQAIGGSTNRFINCSGFATIDQTVDAAAGFACQRVMGMGPIATGNDGVDYVNTKTMLIWGANPAISQIQSMHFLIEAQEQGTKLIVIDPWFNATAAHADQFVPIKAGTDGALALGMMNAIVENGWQDIGFLRDHTVAPILVKESDGSFLRSYDLSGEEATEETTDEDNPALVMRKNGETGAVNEVSDPVMKGSFTVDGIKVTTAYSLLLDRIAEWPVSRAAEETGIDEDTINELARAYACDTPSAIYTFYGIDHYYNGHWSVTDMCVLACLTGNVGKEGAFCGMNESLGTYGRNYVGTLYPLGAADTSMTYNAPLLRDAFRTGEYVGAEMKLKSAFITHSNVLTNAADRNGTLEWMDATEFLVGTDIMMTDTMKYCDIVLPAAHWFETEDVFSCYATHPFMLYQEQAVEPAYESRAGIEILNELADRCGFGDIFDITTEEYIELLFDDDIARAENMSYERLKEEKAFRGMPGPVAIANEGGEFTLLPFSRAAIYLESPVGSNPDVSGWDLEKERLPYWEGALQVNDDERREKYPIHLLSEHSRFRTHSQWWEVDLLREIDTEPFLKLNPIDAAAYGIEAGDQVRVYNELGELTLTAQISKGLPEGMATCPKGGERAEYIDGSFANVFTREVNPFCCNQAFFDCTVAIEKL